MPLETFADLRNEIAQKLKKLRHEKHWTQKNMAQLLDITQGRLSQIESGRGSISAEQIFILIKKFNIPFGYFISTPDLTDSDLQNALSRLGGKHLQENPHLFPSEKLDEALNVIREILLVANSPRQIAGIAPVLVRHINHFPFQKLRYQLAEVDSENRLGWLLENILSSIRDELKNPLPIEIHKIYQRAEIILDRILNNWTQKMTPEKEDLLDLGILSQKTLQQIRSSSSPISKKWGILTRINSDDFLNALKGARENE